MRFTLGDTTDTTGTDTGTDGGPSLLQQIITGFTQYKVGQQQLDTAAALRDYNLQLIRAGKQPIAFDPSLVGAAPGVNVGLSPGTQSLLMYGLLGIGALIAFNIFTKKRR